AREAAGVDRVAEPREAALEARDRALLDEARDDDALAVARHLGLGLGPPRRLRLGREAERHRDRRFLDRPGQQLAREPGAERLDRGAGLAFGPDQHGARVAAVERELG